MLRVPVRKNLKVTVIGSNSFFRVAVLFFIFLGALPPSSFAEKRLLMFTSNVCPSCLSWERDIGAIYDKTPYAKQLPLTRTEVNSSIPNEVVTKAPLVGTPTFVVLLDNYEIDRIIGYSGSEMFWWWLAEHLEK